MKTKWEILIERRARAKEEFDKLDHQIASLQNTPCNLTCSGCGRELETEADFAEHFLIPDERYLNLGWCPEVHTEEDIQTRNQHTTQEFWL